MSYWPYIRAAVLRISKQSAHVGGLTLRSSDNFFSVAKSQIDDRCRLGAYIGGPIGVGRLDIYNAQFRESVGPDPKEFFNVSSSFSVGNRQSRYPPNDPTMIDLIHKQEVT